MTDTQERTTAPGVDLTTPLAIVASDSHAGPRREDLQPYCPADRLEAFDAFYAAHARVQQAPAGRAATAPAPADGGVLAAQIARILQETGAWDMQSRLRHMDRDGVAAEVIYHGTFDGHPIPFVGTGGFVDATTGELDLAAEGFRIYNRWLADACATAPERLIGCLHLPIWDIDACLEEVRWGRDAGLRAISFPSPRRGVPFYDDPAWESFWSACEDLGMVLSTHAGAIDRSEVATDGPHEVFLRMLEAGGWPARRAINRLVFGGVFERHPKLKLVLTEQNHDWWGATIREFDSAYRSNGWQIKDQVPRLPSEYLAEHVFIGASFMAPFEAEAAVRDGYVANVMWGRDYPHPEGTWQNLEADAENETHLSMRHAYAAIEPEHVLAMVSTNAIRVYDLDGEKLQALALEIGAPTLETLGRPIDAVPERGRGGVLSFRTVGAWG